MITLLLNKKIGGDNLALTTNEINTVTLNSDNLNRIIYGKNVDNYIKKYCAYGCRYFILKVIEKN